VWWRDNGRAYHHPARETRSLGGSRTCRLEQTIGEKEGEERSEMRNSNGRPFDHVNCETCYPLTLGAWTSTQRPYASRRGLLRRFAGTGIVLETAKGCRRKGALLGAGTVPPIGSFDQNPDARPKAPTHTHTRRPRSATHHRRLCRHAARLETETATAAPWRRQTPPGWTSSKSSHSTPRSSCSGPGRRSPVPTQRRPGLAVAVARMNRVAASRLGRWICCAAWPAARRCSHS
jgi:hypothetical protein